MDATSENVLPGLNNNLSRKLLWIRNGWAVVVFTQDLWNQIYVHVATFQVNNVPIVEKQMWTLEPAFERSRDMLGVNDMENFYVLVVVKGTDLVCVQWSFFGGALVAPAMTNSHIITICWCSTHSQIVPGNAWLQLMHSGSGLCWSAYFCSVQGDV